MFTGLIDRIGRLSRRESRGAGARVAIAHEGWTDALVPGESVAVQGVCLTVAQVGTGSFCCDVLDETLQRTALGDLPMGAGLNLERALRADGRFGGHLVAGHVDDTGRVQRLARAGADWILDVTCGSAWMPGIVQKGSIAVDGVSLTVAEVLPSGFRVCLIPFTWEHTSLRHRRVGDRINLETDMLGKYVQKYLASLAASKAGGVTLGDLQRAGFA